jgi:hypothetical protein
MRGDVRFSLLESRSHVPAATAEFHHHTIFIRFFNLSNLELGHALHAADLELEYKFDAWKFAAAMLRSKCFLENCLSSADAHA